MTMTVLQLGSKDWSKQYQIPSQLTWIYNDPHYFDQFTKKELKKAKLKKVFAVVLITEPINLTTNDWKKLQWLVDPYRVIFLPQVVEKLDLAGKNFVRLNCGQESNQDPQSLINELPRKYYTSGSNGFKLAPNRLILNPLANLKNVSYPDGGHLDVTISSHNWVTIGSYVENWYVAPNEQLKVWLEFTKETGLNIRLKVFNNIEGQLKSYFIDITNRNEQIIPTAFSDQAQFLSVSIQAYGYGQLSLGYVHGRTPRYGVGHYIPGGQRIVDRITNEEIPFYFNPGDLKPPLNVYFSGVSLVEHFEGKNLMRRMHSPSLVFFDPRLALGQFYTGEYLEYKIKEVIMATLKQLDFTNNDLIVTGISEGSYPAVKVGGSLKAHAIIVGKLLCNLGHIADFGRLHRPNDFQPSYNIVTRLLNQSSTLNDLADLDEDYWNKIDKYDFSNTRIFVAYMENDNFDSQAFEKFIINHSIRNSKQLVYKGYPGHHNDNSYAISTWFTERLKQVLHNDFER